MSKNEIEGPIKSQWERQEGGSHYRHFKIQPSEFIHKNKIDWLGGNAIKYICRAPFKGQFVSDIRKAMHYLQLWLEEWEKENA